MPVKHQPLFEIQIPECEGDILQIQDLTFAYPDGYVALRGIKICRSTKGKKLPWWDPTEPENRP
jgi:hypothetical protein